MNVQRLEPRSDKKKVRIKDAETFDIQTTSAKARKVRQEQLIRSLFLRKTRNQHRH